MDAIELVAETDIKKVLGGLATTPEKQHDDDVAEARKIIGAAKEITTASPSPLEVIAESDHLAPYAEYKPATVAVNAAEYDVHVKEYTDARGRTFYEFDDGRSKPLLACIFETTAGHLIALNGIVMPLGAFQQIVYVRTSSAKLAKASTSRTEGYLRPPVPVSAEKVLCTMADGTVTTLVNTTVQHVMMALQHLAPPANRIETEQAEENVGPLRRLWRWLY